MTKEELEVEIDRIKPEVEEYRLKYKSIQRKYHDLKVKLNFLSKEEKKTEILDYLAIKVKEFTGIDVKDSGIQGGKEVIIAKKLFCKAAFQRSQPSTLTSQYIGYTERSSSLRLYKYFRKECKDKWDSNYIWEQFNKTLNQNSNENSNPSSNQEHTSS